MSTICSWWIQHMLLVTWEETVAVYLSYYSSSRPSFTLLLFSSWFMVCAFTSLYLRFHCWKSPESMTSNYTQPWSRVQPSLVASRYDSNTRMYRGTHSSHGLKAQVWSDWLLATAQRCTFLAADDYLAKSRIAQWKMRCVFLRLGQPLSINGLDKFAFV